MNRKIRKEIGLTPGYMVLKCGDRVTSTGDNRESRKAPAPRGYPVVQPDYAWPPEKGTQGTVKGTTRAGKALTSVTVLWDGEEKPRKMRPWAVQPKHALEILAQEFEDDDE